MQDLHIELMTSVGTTVTSAMMIYNLLVGPNAAGREMYKYVMRCTDDNSTTITGLVGRLT